MNELLEGLGYPMVEVPSAFCVSRCDAIAFLTRFLVQAGRLDEEYLLETTKTLLKRENRGPTMLGCGLALPHVATEAVTQVQGVVGLAANPVPWPEGFDGTAGKYICLLLTPASKPLETLLAEENVIRHLFKSGTAREQAVRLRAYRYWEAAGRPDRNDLHYGYLAEQDLMTTR